MNKNLVITLFFIFSTILITVNNKEKYVGYFIAQPSKCFDCERELPLNKKYMGGPTKCFSCEREIAKMYGSHMADLGQPTKCFSCERQMGPGLRR
tara:strand:+ start:113 stop:397 length:285 start_codon:yes stop_codon:yes gene_type:complete